LSKAVQTFAKSLREEFAIRIPACCFLDKKGYWSLWSYSYASWVPPIYHVSILLILLSKLPLTGFPKLLPSHIDVYTSLIYISNIFF